MSESLYRANERDADGLVPEPTDNQEIERLELECRMRGQTETEAMEAADAILANLGEWEGEAMMAGHQAQSPEAYDAVMREHLADAIYAVLKLRLDSWRKVIRETIKIINWHGHTSAMRMLERLLGES